MQTNSKMKQISINLLVTFIFYFLPFWVIGQDWDNGQHAFVIGKHHSGNIKYSVLHVEPDILYTELSYPRIIDILISEKCTKKNIRSICQDYALSEGKDYLKIFYWTSRENYNNKGNIFAFFFFNNNHHTYEITYQNGVKECGSVGEKQYGLVSLPELRIDTIIYENPNGEKVEKMKEKAKEKKILKDKIDNAEIKRKKVEEYQKKYGNKYGSFIAAGQVKIGMTKEMCIAAWGNPIEKNKQNSVLEKWNYKSKSIYFDKTGIVTAIQ